MVVESMKEVVTQVDKGVAHVADYVKENWKPLAIGGIAVGAVVGYVFLRREKAIMMLVAQNRSGDVIANNMRTIFGPFFSKQNFTLTHYVGAPGNPGIMNYWVEGQVVSPSFRAAADVSGKTPGYVAEVVRGDIAAKEGYNFVRVIP